jgi:hypothetical protein
MTLTYADIKKFQEMYVKYFDKKLTDDVARKKLTALVRQVEITYQPVTITQLSKFVNLNGNGKDNGKLSSRN